MSNLEITKINELAERINVEHDKCLEGIKLGLLHAINVGELLKETKPLIGHGDWLNWIKDNCNFSERTAQNYVRMADNKTELLNTKRVSLLSYRDAIKLLAEPIPEEEPKEYEPHLNESQRAVIDDSITDYQSMFGEAKGQAYKYIVLSQRQGYIRVTPQSFEILPKMENEKRFNVHTWAGIVGELLILHGKGKANAPDNVKWWLGDCLNYGEKKWPKEWKKALNGSYLIAEIFTKHPGAKVEEVIEHLVTEKAIVDK